MASSISGFASLEDARRYLARLNATGQIHLRKPVSDLSVEYVKDIAPNLLKQERAGRAKLSLAEARRHGAGEHHRRIVTIPAKGKALQTYAIGPAPTKIAPERKANGKLDMSGVYRGARVPQVPEIINLINKKTKTNVIAIGIYGYVSFYYDESIQPSIHWLGMVVDKQEFLADLRALDTGVTRKADDPELRALAQKYMSGTRARQVGVDWAYIFRWSARDAKQP